MDLTMKRVGDRWEKMDGYCSTGQSPQQAAVPVEEEEEEEEDVRKHAKNAFGVHDCLYIDWQYSPVEMLWHTVKHGGEVKGKLAN
jgi:hypothetical protein